jgi:hypothetical protein
MWLVRKSGLWMPLAFRIFKLRDDGSQHFVEEGENIEDARERVGDLAGLWPGEYIIQNEETGERVVITSNGGGGHVR